MAADIILILVIAFIGAKFLTTWTHRNDGQDRYRGNYEGGAGGDGDGRFYNDGDDGGDGDGDGGDGGGGDGGGE